MSDEDMIDLPPGDFRRARRYLAPWVFALPGGDEGKTYPPPSDLIPKEDWDGLMTLATDVALKSSSYEGSVIARISSLNKAWIFSWPDPGEAPYMEGVALVVGEELDALLFNGIHGYYRQALGCLRNVVETLMIAAAFSVRDELQTFEEWTGGQRQVRFQVARRWIRDSTVGHEIDEEVAPASVFGDTDSAWANTLYHRLCNYAHGRGGYNNGDFWESNGPIFVSGTLDTIEGEIRETLALAYLLLRIGCPAYRAGRCQAELLAGNTGDWGGYAPMLRRWLLPSP